MYHKSIKIAFIGFESHVLEAIRSVEIPEGLEVSLEDAISNIDDLYTYSLIAVAGSDALTAAQDIKGTLSPDPVEVSEKAIQPRIVLAVDAATAGSLEVDTFDMFFDVWVEPTHSASMTLRFRQFLEHEKLVSELAYVTQCLDTTIDSIPELVWFKDARGAHLKVNDAFCALVDKTKQQIEGRGHYYIWDITPEEYSQGEYVCLESEDAVMQAQKTCLFDEQIKTKEGMRQFKTYKSPLFDSDGSVMGTVGIAHDVTDLGNIKTELDIFINSMPYAVVVLDGEGTILNINDQAESYFAVKRTNVLGGDFDQWRRTVLSDAVVESNDFSDASTFSATIEGRTKTFKVNQRVILDVFNTMIGELRIYRDVTKERELEQRVIRTANTDYLTGLYNRRYLYDFVACHLDEPVALIYLDLDNFKDVNDTFGHQSGDGVLITTSQALTEAFPHDMVVRVGGDEFIVVILGEHDHGCIERQAQTCLKLLNDRLKTGEASRCTTGSMGIAFDDKGELPIDTLIRRSDMALYAAKRAGKSRCYVWTPYMGS